MTYEEQMALEKRLNDRINMLLAGYFRQLLEVFHRAYSEDLTKQLKDRIQSDLIQRGM